MKAVPKEHSFPITFGNKYNFLAGIQVTQKVYDPIQIVSIKNAKASKDISELSTQKTKEDATYDISKAYFQTLVIRMQLNILKNTLKSSEESLRSIELKYQTGVAKKIDVDRIRVSFNNTNSQLEEATLNYKQSLNRLKYAMGMPIDEQITWLILSFPIEGNA